MLTKLVAVAPLYLLLVLAVNAQSNGDLRNGAGEGFLEVYYNGQWGGVCDDHFNQNDAIVACRQMGVLGGSPAFRVSQGNYGTGSRGTFFLDDLACTGTEWRLDQCQCFTSTYVTTLGTCPLGGDHDCYNSEHVKLRCQGPWPSDDDDDAGGIIALVIILVLIIGGGVGGVIACFLCKCCCFKENQPPAAQDQRPVAVAAATSVKPVVQPVAPAPVAAAAVPVAATAVTVAPAPAPDAAAPVPAAATAV